jgi:hypothetical protein
MSRFRSPSRKWRSPKEVLFIREDKESRHHHEPSKPMMSAFESLTQENIELKALVEILKAKNKADNSKHLELDIRAQEVRNIFTLPQLCFDYVLTNITSLLSLLQQLGNYSKTF